MNTITLRKMNLLAPITLFFITWLAACPEEVRAQSNTAEGISGGSAAQNKLSESNKNKVQARTVELGVEPLTLSSSKHIDHWKITMKGRGYLRVAPIKAPKNFNLSCEVTDPFGRKLGLNDVHIDLPGTYLLTLKDRYSSNYSTTTPIQIKLGFTEEEDHAEPNNTIRDAALLSIGRWQQAQLAPGNDLDYYKIQIHHEGRLVVKTKHLDKGVIIASTLYDAAGKKLNTPYPYHLKPGAYFICLHGKYGQWSLKPYIFKLDMIPYQKITPDEVAKSTVIELDKKYFTYLPSPSDEDHFEVALKKPSIIHVSLDLPQGSIYELIFPRGDKKTIRGNPLWVRTSEPKNHFTIASKYSAVTLLPIQMRARVESEFDPSEPNDYLEEAAHLTIGTPATCYLYPSGDIDWFKTTIADSGDYYFHLVLGNDHGVPPPSNIKVFLHDQTGKQKHSFRLTQQTYGYSSQPVSIKNPGVFLLSIQAMMGSYRGLKIGLTEKPSIFISNSDPDTKKSSGMDIFLTGIELNKSSEEAMKKMVRDGGGTFVNAEHADEITQKLIDISDEIETRSEEKPPKHTPPTRHYWPWLTLIILPLVGVYYIFYRSSSARRCERVRKERL